ncbi:MAG: tRNA preQ1(34) S-adenosylmethionine ribosyltransferase-isomerase QueA [Candidatus Marinimicrobia bacterium]|nr:tRNA preQ1(34) S-adenosylmethionine ribosyltransferase-isomerase QueA [Candidatus Neomarinimicrobiota bacterium]MCF7829058.1 tRNA preQ1(34) S-adenosylmethionine ribosyltransferase-isomerase QueA [Candidatus Neomarinimicrobiota bacterium]MCF7881805.1 tRNA preQ1(34) S-adenosylmethionine ribosyltransferase-isomerase QueA [Candidatus Neomarinimicrobiota bacterium]
MTTTNSVDPILQSDKAQLEDFDYELPEDKIAQYPVEPRDSSRLMVVNRSTDTLEHKVFTDVIDYLDEGDVLVLNETRVFPSRLIAVKDQTDAKVEVFLLRELETNIWEVLVNPARKVRIGNKLTVTEELQCDVIDNTISGGRVVRFLYDGDDFYDIIQEIGQAPLPPYIDRDPEPKDKETYQTVFAENRGAVAAPTAGLHFTEDLLNKIQKKGVKLARVTLHIGLGTFRPVTVGDLNRHRMHSENYQISVDAANTINAARDAGKRVIAVGTSSVRVLETSHLAGKKVVPGEGWTDLFIYPPYDYRIVDGMVTNFHQPQSTLIMLVSAFHTTDGIIDAYQTALDEGYRFLSYGDAMLLI